MELNYLFYYAEEDFLFLQIKISQVEIKKNFFLCIFIFNF